MRSFQKSLASVLLASQVFFASGIHAAESAPGIEFFTNYFTHQTQSLETLEKEHELLQKDIQEIQSRGLGWGGTTQVVGLTVASLSALTLAVMFAKQIGPAFPVKASSNTWLPFFQAIAFTAGAAGSTVQFGRSAWDEIAVWQDDLGALQRYESVLRTQIETKKTSLTQLNGCVLDAFSTGDAESLEVLARAVKAENVQKIASFQAQVDDLKKALAAAEKKEDSRKFRLRISKITVLPATALATFGAYAVYILRNGSVKNNFEFALMAALAVAPVMNYLSTRKTVELSGEQVENLKKAIAAYELGIKDLQLQ